MSKSKSVKEALSLEYNVNMYKRKPLFAFIKRLFDILSSLIALIILSPLFLILIILVKIDSKGPAFYGHKRIGKNGKEFKVWKFRSMRQDSRPIEEILTQEQLEEWKRDFKVTNDPRVTRIGRILRKTSLDELPQLLNIVKGDMSIVGPRPPLVREVEQYNSYQMQRLLVTPGLTCFWQAYGRSDLSFDDWMDMDMKYIKRRNIFLDIKLIVKTVFAVIFKRGAY